jgi:hypothetical protein
MSDHGVPSVDEAVEELMAWLADRHTDDRLGPHLRVLLEEMRRLEQAAHPLLLVPSSADWEISEQEQAQFQNAYSDAVQAHRGRIWSFPRTSGQDIAEYQISALHDDDVGSWVQVEHRPCLALIFGAELTDPDGLDVYQLLSRVNAHRCELGAVMVDKPGPCGRKESDG